MKRGDEVSESRQRETEKEMGTDRKFKLKDKVEFKAKGRRSRDRK